MDVIYSARGQANRLPVRDKEDHCRTGKNLDDLGRMAGAAIESTMEQMRDGCGLDA